MHAAKTLGLLAIIGALAIGGPAQAATIIGFGEPGHSATGDWGVNATGWNGGEMWELTPDSGNTSTWDFSGLPAGDYYVSASWTPWVNRTLTAQYDISDGGGTVAVNQQTVLQPFNADGFGWWNLLSDTPVSVADSTLSVTLSDTDPGLFIMADAIRISTQPFRDPNVFYMDSNSPTGYSTTGNWNREAVGASGTSPIFLADEWWQADPTSSEDTATWSFSDLPEGIYRVSATWFPAGNRTTDAVFDISDGGGAVHVNQQVLVEDLNDGTPWQDLASNVSVSDGTLEVTLSDNDAALYLMTDAIRVEWIAIPEPGTLVLLAGGVVALLCSWWRRGFRGF